MIKTFIGSSMLQPSKFQQDIYDKFQQSTDNINISAVAGSGKTTVLLQLLQLIPQDSKALFVAFNNSIVDELKTRIGQKANVEITTVHSYGWHAILSRYGCKLKMNPNKAIAKIEKLFKREEYGEIKEKRKGYYFYIIPKIVDLMRCNLAEPNTDEVIKLCDYYDILAGEAEVAIAIEVFKLMQKDKTQFDFMDMIYQPIVDPMVRVKKYDYVFCDESQDFSRAQQELIRLSLNRKGRLITVGDAHQGIYGFAGADADSYERLSTLNGASVTMPLSVSYRCSKSVVIEAQNIVPEITYATTASTGLVRQGSMRNDLQEGDWVLCRNLKPLVQTYLWLMKNKVKSKIKGKDIGEGIISMINHTGARTLTGMSSMLELERRKLTERLQQRGVKRPDLHPKMELFLQRLEVIECLKSEVDDVRELLKLIGNIFTDETKGIMLSTIHKSKGLENERILFLCPELIPSKFATSPWMIQQEMNLKYVGITRAKDTLIYVNGAEFKQDIQSNIN